MYIIYTFSISFFKKKHMPVLLANMTNELLHTLELNFFQL